MMKNNVEVKNISFSYGKTEILKDLSLNIREGEFMEVKSINIGTRQNSRLRGNNIIDCDYSQESIAEALNKQMNSKNKISSQHLYGNGKAAKTIAHILADTSIRNTQKLNSF